MASLISSARRKHESYDLSGTVYLISSDGKILKVPIPSESPQDPLNWRPRKRYLAIFTVGFYAFVGAILTQGATLISKGLKNEFGREHELFTVETLVSAPSLFLGLGAFIWAPLAVTLGRRPVIIIAAVLMFISNIASGFARNYWELLAAVSVAGLTDGFSFSTALVIVIDLTFIHQRPYAIAMVLSLAGSCSLAASAAIPFLTDHGAEWRRFYYYNCILTGLNCFLVFVLYPETYFKRPPIAFDGRIIVQSATEKIIIYEEDETFLRYSRDPPRAVPKTHLGKLAKMLRVPQYSKAAGCDWRALGHCYGQILGCIANPLIFWTVVLKALNFGGLMFIGATYGPILVGPPYDLPSHLIILVNLSAALGSLLAWPATSPLVGRFLRALSRRNRGVCEAEQYLVGYVLPVLAGAASTLIYGFTVHHHWHFGLVYLSYGLNSFSFTGLAIVNVLWVTEAFPRWATSAIVVVGGGTYVISFALSFAVGTWIDKAGYLGVGVQLAALQLLGGMVAVPCAFWGKCARQRIHGRWAHHREGALRPL